jgi:hypothetical protein
MFLLGLLLEFIIEIFGTILVEMILEFTHGLDEDKSARGVAIVWLLGCSALVGGLTIIVAPERLLTTRLFPGQSLLLTPVVLGGVMEWFGRAGERRNKDVSHLATWYGGAAVGLGLSAGRLIALAFAADVRAL